MDIWKFLGQLIAYGGGAAAIAYVIFIFLGRNVVENWFSRRMEAYKNAQAQELEEFKYKINALFNRVTKIHEKEFDVLPKAWAKLQDVLAQVGNIASPLQAYPDFTAMSETEFHEFIEDTKLRKHEVESLEYLPPEERNKFYKERIFWHELYEAKSRIGDLHNYLLYNKIFLSKDFFEEFGKIDKMLLDIVLEIEENHESHEHKSVFGIWKRLNTEAQEIADRIENLVQEKLHYPEA